MSFQNILPTNTLLSRSTLNADEYMLKIYHGESLSNRELTVAQNAIYQGTGTTKKLFDTHVKYVNWVLRTDGRIYAELPTIPNGDHRSLCESESPTAVGTISTSEGKILVVKEGSPHYPTLISRLDLFVQRLRALGYNQAIKISDMPHIFPPSKVTQPQQSFTLNSAQPMPIVTAATAAAAAPEAPSPVNAASPSNAGAAMSPSHDSVSQIISSVSASHQPSNPQSPAGSPPNPPGLGSPMVLPSEMPIEEVVDDEEYEECPCAIL